MKNALWRIREYTVSIAFEPSLCIRFVHIYVVYTGWNTGRWWLPQNGEIRTPPRCFLSGRARFFFFSKMVRFKNRTSFFENVARTCEIRLALFFGRKQSTLNAHHTTRTCIKEKQQNIIYTTRKLWCIRHSVIISSPNNIRNRYFIDWNLKSRTYFTVQWNTIGSLGESLIVSRWIRDTARGNSVIRVLQFYTAIFMPTPKCAARRINRVGNGNYNIVII